MCAPRHSRSFSLTERRASTTGAVPMRGHTPFSSTLSFPTFLRSRQTARSWNAV
nr:MAG TPA: hypothetical protein [Caudoviricetes sp.]